MGFSFAKIVASSLIIFMGSHAGFAAPQKDEQVRIQKKLKRLDLKRLNLSTEVPQYHDYLGWKIDGSINGEVIHQTAVPTIEIDFGTFQIRDVSTIPVGTKVSLQKFVVFKDRNFFQVKRKDTNQLVEGLVDGMFIVAAGDILSSPDQ